MSYKTPPSSQKWFQNTKETHRFKFCRGGGAYPGKPYDSKGRAQHVTQEGRV